MEGAIWDDQLSHRTPMNCNGQLIFLVTPGPAPAKEDHVWEIHHLGIHVENKNQTCGESMRDS